VERVSSGVALADALGDRLAASRALTTPEREAVGAPLVAPLDDGASVCAGRWTKNL
jgi:hypothetical protein